MAYSWTHDGVHTRQHRASTVPVPPQASFPTIPPSLIPGRRHRQTFSATPTAVNGIPYSAPGNGIHPMTKVPTSFLPGTGIPGYHAMNPSLYHDFQPPPPPPLPPPLPQSQAPVLPRLQQPAVPPLPPKTPINTSPSSVSPTVPPKPPPFVPPPPPLDRPKLSSRSQSQPPHLKPRSSSQSLPPPPPIPPQRPLGARSSSAKAISNTFQQPYATPSANPGRSTSFVPSIGPSPSTKESPDTEDTPLPPTPSVTSTVDGRLGMNEEEELELALELSAHTEREHANSLLSQDEEFARALERSLFDSPPPPVHGRLQSGPSVVDGDNVPSSSSMDPWDTYSHSSKQSSHAPSPLLAPSLADAQLKEDEALARSLEAQYQSERTSPTIEKNHDADPNPSGVPLLPRYADVVSKEAAVEHHESHAMAQPRVQQVSTPPAPVDQQLSVSDQANTPRTSPSPAQRSSPRPEALAIQASSEEEEAPEIPSSSPQSSRALVTPNQFVEPELLYGVSFGFNTPPTQDFEMRGPLPNIIALPYGKSPPMHIRAQNWRQLLKLMAKLSATQVEPSVEAVAATKGELQLRTVIQFFKVHPNSSNWRTVIYFTIDHPPPPDHRSTSLDVNALPYSYRLSSLPTLLRDGSDSQISKYYTVPATARTPWPKLPISMPNMANYLTTVLEDSRRALSDSSSGLRRLAKMIDQFYPNQGQVPGGEDEVRRRGLLGRLMGRSTKAQRGPNAEVYDLVTPFVPDEWG